MGNSKQYRNIKGTVTISIDDYKTNSMFSNGIKQNVLTLRETFENCKNVRNSYISNRNHAGNFKGRARTCYINTYISISNRQINPITFKSA